MQISTHNASSIEQRAIFDQSPKLAQMDNSRSSNKHHHHEQDTILKAMTSKKDEKEDATIMTELGQPELLQAKKIVNLDGGPSTAMRVTSSAKPLNNVVTATTAF